MRWKSRVVAFVICFAIGFLVAAIVAAILSRFNRKRPPAATSPCASADYFNTPEEVLASLKNPEVEARRAMHKRLLLRPEIATVYYDYERDLNYPERADRARLQYVQLDDSPEQEALLTYVRFEHPVAFIFKKESCGWKLIAALSSWLRFEDYPYDNWLTLPKSAEPGIKLLLVRDSYGDATSYVRKARLLRLNGGAVTQVAEIEEESIQPVAGYQGADWNNLKRHRFNNYSLTSGISNVVTEEIIKLNGAAPRYSYWLETDGSWHARESNWSRRPATRVKLLGTTTEVLSWNSQEGRYVKP